MTALALSPSLSPSLTTLSALLLAIYSLLPSVQSPNVLEQVIEFEFDMQFHRYNRQTALQLV